MDFLHESPPEDRTQRIREMLKKEYVLVGKNYIRTWHAWLVIGLVAGTAIGVILVANRSGEVETGKAFEGADGVAMADLSATEVTLLNPKIVYRTQICDRPGCYWEMVFAGHPKDPKKLFVADATTGFLSRSVDAGRTWVAEEINTLAGRESDTDFVHLDPKIVITDKGDLYFSALAFKKVVGSTSEERVGALFQGGSQGGLTYTPFQDVLMVPEAQGNNIDRPNMVVDQKSGTIYISAIAWHESLGARALTLFVSRDGGKTFSKDAIGEDGSKKVMALGSDGTLYAAWPGHAYGQNNQLVRFTSFDPPTFDVLPLPGHQLNTVRLDTTSTRVWEGYGGPEIVADNGRQSPHRGRLYTVWAQEERLEREYGFNLDVFASYSDDRGETWSPAVRVNDDIGTGDQFFPSARIDEWGRLHIAFIDHRDNQDKAVFDVYYAFSADGANFSKNIKVTDTPTGNNGPAESQRILIGDYLDMVMPYRNRVYVAYPCGSHPEGYPAGACMAEIKFSSRRSP